MINTYAKNEGEKNDWRDFNVIIWKFRLLLMVFV